MQLTQEYLKERLHYDPDTGIFTWKYTGHKPWDRLAGRRAGCAVKQSAGNMSYVSIRIDGKLYLAHRLAFLYMEGNFPINETDHIDRNGLNNKWNNLREATHAQNAMNRVAQINNKTGFKGVCYAKRESCYCAYIQFNGKRKNLGLFQTPEEAHEVYKAAAEKSHGEFAKTS